MRGFLVVPALFTGVPVIDLAAVAGAGRWPDVGAFGLRSAVGGRRPGTAPTGKGVALAGCPFTGRRTSAWSRPAPRQPRFPGRGR
ncbi:hypothetical protein GCM10022630_29540 [Thermobifida alba]